MNFNSSVGAMHGFCRKVNEGLRSRNIDCDIKAEVCLDSKGGAWLSIKDSDWEFGIIRRTGKNGLFNFFWEFTPEGGYNGYPERTEGSLEVAISDCSAEVLATPTL